MWDLIFPNKQVFKLQLDSCSYVRSVSFLRVGQGVVDCWRGGCFVCLQRGIVGSWQAGEHWILVNTNGPWDPLHCFSRFVREWKRGKDVEIVLGKWRRDRIKRCVTRWFPRKMWFSHIEAGKPLKKFWLLGFHRIVHNCQQWKSESLRSYSPVDDGQVKQERPRSQPITKSPPPGSRISGGIFPIWPQVSSGFFINKKMASGGQPYALVLVKLRVIALITESYRTLQQFVHACAVIHAKVYPCNSLIYILAVLIKIWKSGRLPGYQTNVNTSDETKNISPDQLEPVVDLHSLTSLTFN